jgi:hypothetical protein
LLFIVCPAYLHSLHADLTFNVAFTSAAEDGLSQAQRDLFSVGLSFWDEIIIGHRDLVPRNWTLTVDIFSAPSSGGGILLGSAGPSGVTFSNEVADAATSDRRFIISTGGIANFNIHPDAVNVGSLGIDTIRHELGHALGIGTLWEDNELYNDGVANNSNRTRNSSSPGQYLGAFGLEAFRNEFVGQQSAAFVPVELSGGPGTAHGHWDESDNFGQSPTGLVTFAGLDMQDELMTGYASPRPDFLSNLTRESLRDIGFNIVAVPEPHSFLLVSVACLLSGLYRIRKS